MGIADVLLTKIVFSISLIMIILIMGVIAPAQQAFSQSFDETVYSVDRKGFLSTINPRDATTISIVQITIDDKKVKGGTALAADPDTGELFAILKTKKSFLPNDQKRILATIDPDTGAATIIGPASQAFAELAFDFSGTLFAVSGSGADIPNTLFTLDTTDASATFVCTLVNGLSGGQTIAFNPRDGNLYHGSGFGGTRIFEKITNTSTETCTTTNIPLTDDPYTEQISLTFWPSEGIFLMTTQKSFGRTSNLFTITEDGKTTGVGTVDHDALGLTVLTPRALKAHAINEIQTVRDLFWWNVIAIEELDEAIESINESLDQKLWAKTALCDIDPLHLNPDKGRKVFGKQKQAAEEIFDAIEEGEIDNTTIIDELLNIVNKLVTADRVLAKIAINDAKDIPGADQEEITEAEQRFAEGDQLIEDAKAETDLEEKEELISDAIDDSFRHAWDAAIDAVEDVEDEEEEDVMEDTNDAIAAIAKAQEEINKAQEKIDEAAEDGKETTLAQEQLNKAKSTLEMAQESCDSGDFEDAEELAEVAEDLASEARKLIGKTEADLEDDD